MEKHKEIVKETVQDVISTYESLKDDAVYKLALVTSVLICRLSVEYPYYDVIDKIDFAIKKDIESNPELERSFMALRKGVDLILESETFR